MALRSLSEHPDFTFPAGAFDVRGWDVKTKVDEEKVGVVHDVLLGESGSPRYLDVDLGFFKKHVLLPIGHARVDEAADVVWVPGVTKDQFKDIPEYTHDLESVTPDYETRISQAYTGVYAGEQYYARPEYSTERLRMTGSVGATEGRLAAMDDLNDFKVADQDPDPRGWDVIASDGRTVGAVHELIVDTSAQKVRYLDCELDADALGIEDRNRRVLIPVGYARLDEDSEKVIVDAISSSQIATLPAFDKLPLDRTVEEDLHRAFTGGYSGERRYEHPRYRADHFFQPRGRPATGDTDRTRITGSEEDRATGMRGGEARINGEDEDFGRGRR